MVKIVNMTNGTLHITQMRKTLPFGAQEELSDAEFEEFKSLLEELERRMFIKILKEEPAPEPEQKLEDSSEPAPEPQENLEPEPEPVPEAEAVEKVEEVAETKPKKKKQ